jgi:hypothetical protein
MLRGLAALAVLASASAFAQSDAAKVTQYVPDADAALTEVKPQSWDYTLTLSANFALAQNNNMVGQPEGTSYLIGLGAVGNVLYVDGPHELKLTLALVESFSKTPVLNSIVKANDLARLEAMYSYYFLKWLGGYGRASFESPLLTTNDVRSDLTTYSITRLDGTVDTVSARSLRVASAIQPLTLNQSLGLVAKPVETEPANLSLRAGAGARETFADGVLVNKDDKATLPVEYLETATVIQAGVEAALGVNGKLPEQRLSYGVDFAVLFPFLNNDALNRSVGQLTRVGLAGNLNFSAYEWLGLTYQLLVQRDPQLVSGVQVQNNVFLTFKYDVIPARKVEKVDPLEEAKAAQAAAEQRAQDAEARAVKAEERVKQLESPAAPAQP